MGVLCTHFWSAYSYSFDSTYSNNNGKRSSRSATEMPAIMEKTDRQSAYSQLGCQREGAALVGVGLLCACLRHF